MSFVTTDTHLLDLEVPFLLEEMIFSKPFVDRHAVMVINLLGKIV